jgi:hypothetical protein
MPTEVHIPHSASYDRHLPHIHSHGFSWLGLRLGSALSSTTCPSLILSVLRLKRKLTLPISSLMSGPCFIQELLSTDILREIFTQLTLVDNAEFSTYPFYDMRQDRAPLVLTYVCSQWRRIALGTPALWSSLRIDIENLLVPSSRQELYGMWLDRAWGTPVSLYIIDTRRSRAKFLDTADWIGFLLEHIPYWRNLSTGPCVGNALFRGLLSKPKGTARHLEGLCISFSEDDPLATDCHGKLSSLFPNLSQLDLSASSYDGFVDIPTNQLTHLACNISFFKALLSAGRAEVTFSKLVELELYFAAIVWQMRPGHKQIIFPELQLIKIYDTDPKAFLSQLFLSTVDCPRLEILHIDYASVKTVDIPSSPPESGDFSFFNRFLPYAPCLRYISVRHPHFITTAFLNHPLIRNSVDYVHVSFHVASTLYHTVDHARQAFGGKWAEQALEFAFLTGRQGSPYTTAIAFIGWSRIPGHPVGRPYPRKWTPAFWDQGAYAAYVTNIRDSYLVRC